MQQPAPSTPSASFAGMLAALAAPTQKRPPARDLDGLEDDVATLSYERALRTHARYRSPQTEQPAVPKAPPAEDIRIFEAIAPEETVPIAAEPVAVAEVAEIRTASPPAEALPASEPLPAAPLEAESAFERNRKCASITIRMSRTECAQMRKRAAEAGMTVSAYLRSCSLEAESLRAMVKDTMLQLRAEAEKNQRHEARPQASLWAWLASLRRFWPRTRASQQVARA